MVARFLVTALILIESANILTSKSTAQLELPQGKSIEILTKKRRNTRETQLESEVTRELPVNTIAVLHFVYLILQAC